MKRFLAVLLVNIFLISQAVASNQEKIDWILKEKNPPFGVVFEIVEGNESDLQWAIAEVKKYSGQLRKRFPDIGIAVVSHGSEQFGLMKSEAKDLKEVHATVKSLVQDDSIPVHVCGTHASWYGKTADDFPEYVDVSPAGPTEIANYEDMGYEKIVLEEPQ
jgi:intracellular sulfur oxidation DsrE/DsrF family protein